MMPEGRWAADAIDVETSPNVAGYREGYRDGRVDALVDVLSILNSLPAEPGSYAEAYRRIGELQEQIPRMAR